MTPTPFISVIIPTRNHARLLADTVASVRDQQYPADRYEIIVVNDGSTDQTESVTQRFLDGKLPAVRYLSQPPTGLNTARNNGLRHARADYIVFTDDDVETEENWLAAYANAFQTHPTAGAWGGPVYPRIEGNDFLPHVCGECGSLEELEMFDRGKTDITVDWVIGANFAVPRTTIDQIGFFNEEIRLGYADETEWMIRVQRVGLTIQYVSQARIWHRRPAAEVRHMLIKRRFRKSMGGVWYAREAGGPPPSPLRALRRTVRYGYHALRRDCHVGRVKAVSELGVLCGLIKWIWLRTPTPASPSDVMHSG